VMSKDVDVGSRVKSIDEASACKIEGKSLVLLQVNCRSANNKALQFCNLVDTYIADFK